MFSKHRKVFMKIGGSVKSDTSMLQVIFGWKRRHPRKKPVSFGVVYDSSSSVVYKDVGARSPAYIPVKVKKKWYEDEGWQKFS